MEFEGETNLELVAFLREVDKSFLGTDDEHEGALSSLLAKRLQVKPGWSFRLYRNIVFQEIGILFNILPLKCKNCYKLLTD